MTTRFADRGDAGRRLAERLLEGADDLHDRNPVVLGLPRGGVPVAVEVARALRAPFDVIVVRKLGTPGQPELAIGAIGEDGVMVLDDEVMAAMRVGEEQVEAIAGRERAELERRSASYRLVRPREPLAGRTVVVVDDGVATGSTARAACQVARAAGAARIVVAVPVAPVESIGMLGEVADEVVCVWTPDPFVAVGQFYDDFSPTSEDDVLGLLAPEPDRTT